MVLIEELPIREAIDMVEGDTGIEAGEGKGAIPTSDGV